MQDADILLYLTDTVETPDKNEQFLQTVVRMSEDRGPAAPKVIVVLNKMDLVDQPTLVQKVEEWHNRLPQADIIPISALHAFGTDILLNKIKELLPECPPYFDKDQLTDKPARFFVTEIIREKILELYDKEIPYACEVRVERFKESDKLIDIDAVIFCERDSQKGILIGKQGAMLKKLGMKARKDIEAFFGKQVMLNTFVKVEKDWRNNLRDLNAFGYKPE